MQHKSQLPAISESPSSFSGSPPPPTSDTFMLADHEAPALAPVLSYIISLTSFCGPGGQAKLRLIKHQFQRMLFAEICWPSMISCISGEYRPICKISTVRQTLDLGHTSPDITTSDSPALYPASSWKNFCYRCVQSDGNCIPYQGVAPEYPGQALIDCGSPDESFVCEQ